MNDDVDLVAYDANGNRVPGVRILANVDSRHLVMENGYLKGLSEGEAALQLAIRAPPSSGKGRSRDQDVHLPRPCGGAAGRRLGDRGTPT